MAVFTAEQIEEHGKKALQVIGDTFEWTDLIDLVPHVMQIAGQVADMTNEEKHASAVGILNYVIDKTDIPWLPDSYVDPILKKGVDKLIPILFDAFSGKYSFTASASEVPPPPPPAEA